MRLSTAILKLNRIFDKEGNLELYLDVNEDVSCGECGELKSHTHDGFCQFISTINFPDKKCVWLFAKQC